VKAYEDKWIADDPIPTRGELRMAEGLAGRGRSGKIIAWLALLVIVGTTVAYVVNALR
jgi:hypothetical protein